MLGRGVNETWRDGPPTGVWDGMLSHLQSLDGLFVNLECCLSSRGQPRPGRTYHFQADPDWAVPALVRAGVTWASLANNHLLDFGTTALTDTRRSLNRAGIAHAGAGETLDQARQPSIVEVGAHRLALLAFTDQAPSYAAGPGRAGVSYLRMTRRNPETRRVVREGLAKARRAGADLVVASLHWGPNWVTAPASRYQRFAHWLIDEGVDLIHGHSAHVFQGIEVYRGRPIIHDAGDFVDDYVVKPDLRNDRSFLFRVGLGEGVEELSLMPVEIVDQTVRPAEPEAASWLRSTMRERSATFGTKFERDGNDLVVSRSQC